MIIGTIRIENGTIVTHKKTFVLSPLTFFDVNQPFLIPSRLLAGAFIGFTVAFSDLLYPIEIASILGASLLSIVAGWQVAQLRLHGSDLRGTTYGQALWGRYASLQKVRSDIAVKLDLAKETDRKAGR